MQAVQIAGRWIGRGYPSYLIAEAGVNHNGDMDMALALVDAAAEAGADAVKFQTFSADRLVTKQAPKAKYQLETTDQTESQYQMLKKLELSEEAHRILLARCQQKGVLFLSSPFDETSADLLESLDVPAYKIPSGEITNHPYLAYVARKGRPVILSTGMSSLGEVEAAVQTIAAAGNPPLVLLHCVSQYPAPPEELNLRAMHTLEAAFGVPVGFSDHTEGIEMPLVAVALGAAVIEKHFTLDRSLPGPDHCASLESDELQRLAQGMRRVQAALGDGRKLPTPSERNTADVARKSLVAACDIPAGTVLTAEFVAVRRPGTGLPPALRQELIGRRIKQEIAAGQLFTWEDMV
ncbi:MAG: N-acetylneuraminate synthase [Anaerolineaceae bacterium]|nr:N-acetylneuraminate synthase [Anaerolineaceae bacterium]